MRKREFTVGSLVHIFNRGNRRQAIVREGCDKWHFLQMLYYFNTSVSIANPFKSLRKKMKFGSKERLIWPRKWPRQKPIVKIIAFALVDNHFHLLLKEIVAGGIALFMQKIGVSMTFYFNKKYKETGRLFQGSYKASVVDNDEYLKYLSVYIQVKNILEIYPKGFQACLDDFDKAFDWVIGYPYCSLADYVDKRNSPIIDKDILGEIFLTFEEYKVFAKDCIFAINLKEKVEGLSIYE